MIVKKIHPDEAYRDKLDDILSMTMHQRLERHKILTDRIYIEKNRMKSFEGFVVRKVKK